ncbi:MAG: hypothetical protein FD123_519 [Bacteroidetes bacterium]|nr:MAG: hypothetical protein FD123_519 [Bacteroidota bacterium]
MQSKEDILKKYFAKADIGGTVSVNDIRDKDFNGDALSEKERQALRNFDHYRLTELNKQQNDMDFHECYRKLQVLANLADYREFLKEGYFFEEK